MYCIWRFDATVTLNPNICTALHTLTTHHLYCFYDFRLKTWWMFRASDGKVLVRHTRTGCTQATQA